MCQILAKRSPLLFYNNISAKYCQYSFLQFDNCIVNSKQSPLNSVIFPSHDPQIVYDKKRACFQALPLHISIHLLCSFI